MRPAARSGFRALAAASLLALLAACGGGGDGDGDGPLTISTTAVNDGVIGTAYSQTVATTGGRGAKTFSISGGALPAGLSISAGGAITGTPTGPTGASNFTVSVTDSANTPATDTQALTINIVDPLVIQTATLPDTAVGDDYADAVVAVGGLPPYDFSVDAGALPDGIDLAADGAVEGTVAASARTETFTVAVADSSAPGLTATQEYTVRVALEVATTALADATGGADYSDQLQALGGLPPLTWTITAGALPAGLTLDPDGTVSGTPDAACAAATSTLTVQVEDSDTPSFTDSQAGVDLTVNPAALGVTTTSLPNAVVNTAYSQTIAVSGGVPPYTFAVTGGALPSQLALGANDGRITGTPDTLETQAFEVTVTDACPDTATADLSITVASAVLGRNDSIATATTLPGDGTYSASISPSGHPSSVFSPDEDYYSVTPANDSDVTIDINAVVNGSPLDSVIEVVNAGGVPLSACGAPGFTSVCVHDDEDTASGQLDSFLELRVDGGTTFYIHVVDWGSNARPDKLYDLVISGVQ